VTIDGNLEKYPDFVCKKVCNICNTEFVDNTKNRSKKSCSPNCRRKFCARIALAWHNENIDRYNEMRRRRRERGHTPTRKHKDPDYYV